jgi:hypothetical protein
VAKSNTSTPSDAVTVTPEIDPELKALLESAGVDYNAVNIPSQDFAYPVPLDELCSIKWPELPKALVSPPMVVKRVAEFPEGEKFPGYKGFVRLEAALPNGEYVAWSTHLFNKTTGELGPIAEYIRSLSPPFAMRVGSFETSTPPRRVFRPVPLLEPIHAKA